MAEAIREYGRTARHLLDTHESSAVSYAALWLLLATLAPLVSDEDAFRADLGLSIREANAVALELLRQPHGGVATALGAWMAPGLDRPSVLPVRFDDLPPHDVLHQWTREVTCGLLDEFPVAVAPDNLLLLASALVCRPRWSGGVQPGDEDSELIVTERLLAVVETSVGTVAVAKPNTAEPVDVLSVIAAPEVPAARAWDAVDDVVGMLAAGQVATNSFPSSMRSAEVESGHAWGVHDSIRTYWSDAPPDGAEVWDARLPAWSATTCHNLLNAPGVSLVTESLRAFLPKPDDIQCVQGATACYDETGFSAAAVTSLALSGSLPQPEWRRVRQVTLRFDRPHAVVAVARGGAWDGIPLFQSWVSTSPTGGRQ